MSSELIELMLVGNTIVNIIIACAWKFPVILEGYGLPLALEPEPPFVALSMPRLDLHVSLSTTHKRRVFGGYALRVSSLITQTNSRYIVL